jgi:antitoxin CptB
MHQQIDQPRRLAAVEQIAEQLVLLRPDTWQARDRCKQRIEQSGAHRIIRHTPALAVKPGTDATVDNSGNGRADIGVARRYINPARHVRAFGVGLGFDMTGTTRSSGGLDDRRKRLLFRCWHRGTREMDLILGRFADAEIANLSDDELGTLERLIEVPDPDLYAALTGDAPLSPEHASALFDRIKAFRAADHDA